MIISSNARCYEFVGNMGGNGGCGGRLLHAEISETKYNSRAARGDQIEARGGAGVKGCPFTRDFPLQRIFLYNALLFLTDSPLQWRFIYNMCFYKRFPLARDLPLQGIPL